MLKIIIVSFDFSGYQTFEKMTNALIYSIEKHEPSAQWVVKKLNEPPLNGRIRGHVANTIKLNYWYSELKRCSHGDHVVFLDADTLMINPIHDVFREDFDVAYTVRTRSKWVLNGGVIFVKVNERSMEFFRKFVETNNHMFNDKEFHEKYRVKYAGINQAALGYMLELNTTSAKLKALPCAVWNACGEDWSGINDTTRIIHLNGQARKSIFGGNPAEHETLKPYQIWNKYYNEWRTDDQLTKDLGDQGIDYQKLAEV
jgi:hypothetical protein